MEQQDAEPGKHETENQSDATSPSGKLERIAESAEQVKAAAAETPRPEISASAVARMMGVATGSEMKLLESKIDMLSTRISNLGVRLERALTTLNQIPTGADLERIDVQIGALKTLLKDTLAAWAREQDKGEAGQKPRDAAAANPSK